MDCQDSFFNDKENIWRICICYKVSKHGKRDDDKDIIVYEPGNVSGFLLFPFYLFI